MNKHIKIVAIVATVIIAVSIIVFVGCKKEDLVKQNNTEKKVEKIKKSISFIPKMDYKGIENEAEFYNRHLEHLNQIKDITGIDIVDFVQQEEPQIVLANLNQSLTQLTLSIDNGMVSGSALQKYESKALKYKQNGDENKSVQLLSQISTQMFPMDMLDIEYYRGQEVFLPKTFIENLSDEMESLSSLLTIQYPVYNDLTEAQKTQIIEEVLGHYDIDIQLDEAGDDDGGMCFGPLEKERDRAIREARIILAMETIGWIGSAAGGPVAGITGTILFVAACRSYDKAVDTAWKIYWLKGGKESRH